MPGRRGSRRPLIGPTTRRAPPSIAEFHPWSPDTTNDFGAAWLCSAEGGIHRVRTSTHRATTARPCWLAGQRTTDLAWTRRMDTGRPFRRWSRSGTRGQRSGMKADPRRNDAAWRRWIALRLGRRSRLDRKRWPSEAARSVSADGRKESHSRPRSERKRPVCRSSSLPVQCGR